jgi:hypothetical protein
VIFCDSSIAFYGAGSIGYRWAAKVLAEISRHRLPVTADSLMCLEVADQHAGAGDHEGARVQLAGLREIFPPFETVTAEDFDLSAELFASSPSAPPRLLLRAAVMKRKGSRDLIATFSARSHEIPGIRRVNLMDEMNREAARDE